MEDGTWKGLFACDDNTQTQVHSIQILTIVLNQ